MTRYEEFKREVENCKSPLELTALLMAASSSVCPINTQEGRCDMKVCRQFSNDCCIYGMKEYFESKSPREVDLDSAELKIRHKKVSFNWKFLRDEIRAGNARKYLRVEDEIEISLKDGRTITVIVAGIDTYQKNEVLFTLKDCWFEEFPMNDENTNKGAYANSKMATYTLLEILKLLPDDLLEVITPRTITQVIDGKEHTIDAKIWLWSPIEVFGEDEFSSETVAANKGDKWVEIFKHRRNRIKEFNGQASSWWLRCPHIYSTTYFWGVHGGGNVGYGSGAGNSIGVCFGFRIS